MGLRDRYFMNQGSLKRLRTARDDVYYWYYWDLHISVEEIIVGLYIRV